MTNGGLGNSGPPLGIRGNGDWGLGTGDWGLGIRDWGLGKRKKREIIITHYPLPIINAQCPMPHAHLLFHNL
ncbi:hypothetical protein FDUTEX481_08712 [Tolypothrix sp. PCC 7601]|nr:hypothetical protein FDUTEX481_08712 [Tolypothrix sp. PCC 7601]